MKKIGKWAAFVVIGLILIVIIAASYIVLALPDVGKPEDIKVAITPSRVARGAYLANYVAVCMDCHSQRDFTKPLGEIPADKFGSGGNEFNANDGLPGSIYVPNITPYGLKNWTDGELLRALTTGERKDGTAMFPMMPWPNFSKMSREDVYSLIAYLRTLKPITTAAYPRRVLNFPLNIMVHTIPKKATPGEVPPLSDTVRYGAYLVSTASCGQCHSQQNNGTPVTGLEFAGGQKFNIDGQTVLSANITPDKNSGIGNWTREAFVQRFKTYRDPAQKPKLRSSVMPWYDYAGMNETDLKAIYAYLRTLKPVNNKIAAM